MLIELLEHRHLLAGEILPLPTYDLRNVVDLNSTVASSSPTAAIEMNGSFYFAASTATHGSELWKSDGTVDGTSQLVELVDGDGSSNPRSFFVDNGSLYFVADAPYVDPASPPGPGGGPVDSRMSVFRSDGTAAGTQLLATLGGPGGGGLDPSGSSDVTFMMQGTQLLFVAPDEFGMGQELWRTNGTPAGTAMIAALPAPMSAGPGSPSASIGIPNATVGNVLMFNLNVDSMSGTHTLWRTDGTAAGTYMLRESEMSNPSMSPMDPSIVVAGGHAYFVSSSMNEGQELWRTNGTLGGTTMVSDIVPGIESSGIESLVSLGNTVYFSAKNDDLFAGTGNGRELWRSNSVTGVTSMVKDIDEGYGDGVQSKIVAWQGSLYFAGQESATGNEIWKSDGTTGGTSILVNAGPGSVSLYPIDFIDAGNRLLVQTASFGAPYGAFPNQLWATDGTPGGTQSIASVVGHDFHKVGNRVFFRTVTGSYGSSLWVSDGTTAGTLSLSNLNPGNAAVESSILATTSSGVLYVGTNPTLGTELGISNGTVAGTRLIDVARGTPGANIRDVLKVGNTLYVGTRDELFAVNESNSTKTLMKSFGLYNGATELATAAGLVYFSAEGSSAQGRELWQSNGTVAGTVLARDIRTGTESSNPRKLTPFDGSVYFVATNAAGTDELWYTETGDIKAKLRTSFGGADIDMIQEFGDRLYVIAGDVLYTVNRNVNGGGVVALAATNYASIMTWDNTVYFTGYSPAYGNELWRTDGTAAGTYMVQDILPGPGSSDAGGGAATEPGQSVDPDQLTSGASVESRLIFRANISENNSQLFSTNGTSAGTRQLTNFPIQTDEFGNVNSFAPVNLVGLGDRVLFEAYDPATGRELWESNGTANGTRLVADLRPGATPDPTDPNGGAFLNIKGATAFQDQIFFRTNTTASGNELWTSDGTATGSRLAVDAIAGSRSGHPTNLFTAGNRLYLTADTLDYGVATNYVGGGELFYVNESPHALSAKAVATAGVPNSIVLLGSDRDGDTLTYELQTPPTNGVAMISGGVLNYTPNGGFAGTETLSYRAFDGSLYSAWNTFTVAVQANPHTISFATSQTNVVESNGRVEITVQLDRPAERELLIPYRYSGGDGNRQSAIGGDLYFAVGEPTATAVLYLQDNNVYQPQTTNIAITLQPNEYAAIGAIGTHIVAVTDNDGLPLLTIPQYIRSVPEADVTEEIVLTLSHPSDLPVSVVASFSHLTNATRDVDYIAPLQTTVEFAPGQLRKVLPVRILQDTIAENRELIHVSLSSPSGATLPPTVQGSSHLLWIDDDDTSVVSIPNSYMHIGEGETATVIAERSGGNLSLPLTVPFELYARGATLGNDYTFSGPQQFSFAANSATASVQFPLIADGIDEGWEAFEVILSGSGYAQTDHNSAWVVIGNIDMSVPSISMALPEVTERATALGNRTVDVIVRLSNPSTTPVTVPVRVSDGSISGYAKRGTDFQFSTADFVFTPGTTELRRAVTILDDSISEPAELIRFSLGTELFDRPIWQDKDRTTELTILDDEYGATITGPTSVAENVGELRLTVNKQSQAGISADYVVRMSGSVMLQGSIADVTSASVSDLREFSLPFGTGQTSRDVVLNVRNNSGPIYENTETLLVQVGRYVGSQFVPLATHSVTITDNDRKPTVSLGEPLSDRFGLWGGESDRIPIKISSTLNVPTRVSFRLEGDAKLGRDYTIAGVIPGQLAIDIPAGQDTVYININPIATNNVNDLTVSMVISGTVGLEIPPNPPRSNVTIRANKPKPPTSNAICIPATSAPIATVPSTLAIGTSLGNGPVTCFSTTGSTDLSNVNIGNSNNGGVIQASQLAISIGSMGYLNDSTAFFDANFNGIADFIDLDDDGRQDPGEPNEPSVLTNPDGSFVLPMLSILDQNNNGLIDASEGRFVVTGGVDTSTGLPLRMPLTAPHGGFAITPISTVMESLSRRHGLTSQVAINRISSALGLDGYNFATGNAIDQIIVGDELAKRVYVQQVQVASLTIAAASLMSGNASGGFAGYAQAVTDALADRMTTPGSLMDFSNVATVRGVLETATRLLPGSIPPATLDGVAALVASRLAGLTPLANDPALSPLGFLETLVRSKKVLQGVMADDLALVGSGSKSIAQVTTTYNESAFSSLASSQSIGQIVPAALVVSNAYVDEGGAGEIKTLRFEVSLVGQHNESVSVAYQTRDAGATAGVDYIAASGVLNWAVGDNDPKFVDVTVNGDSQFESDETMILSLSDSIGAVIRSDTAYGFINNDEAATLVMSNPVDNASEVVIAHSKDRLSVVADASVLADGLFYHPTTLSIDGVSSSSTSNHTTIDFSEGTYRDDHYTITGNNGNDDTLALAGGQFQSLWYSAGSFDQNIAAVAANNERVAVSFDKIETLRADVSSVDIVYVRMNAGFGGTVIVEDADAVATGTMRVRHADGYFRPLEFTAPDQAIVIVSSDVGNTLSTPSTDALFTGTVSMIQGGVTLSNQSIPASAPAGTVVAQFSTADPWFTSGYTASFTSGEGPIDNDLFVIDSNELRRSNVPIPSGKTNADVLLRFENAFGDTTYRFATIALQTPLDQTPPLATIAALPMVSTSQTLTLSVSVNDPPGATNEPVSGVAHYDLFMATDANNDGWVLIHDDVPASTQYINLYLDSNTRYWFRAVATDNAGNVETSGLIAETGTRTADIEAPLTTVSASVLNQATGLIRVNITGTDPGNSGIKEFRLLAAISPSQSQQFVLPAVADGNGGWSASIDYQGRLDGDVHNYLFDAYAIDRTGNGSAVHNHSVYVNATFVNQTLTATGLQVQNGQMQRSFINAVDVIFNNNVGLQDLINAGRVSLQRFAMDGSGTGTNVLGMALTAQGNRLQLRDSGINGLGGKGQAGDGNYRIGIDFDGDGTADQTFDFFRLYGDATGDGIVDQLDQSNVKEDLDGDGRIGVTDRIVARNQRGRSITGIMN